MNYTEFIKKADQAMESMPAEKLAAFLHDHARRIPEYKREEFLGRLYAFSNQDLEEGHIQKLDAHDRESLLEEISKMMERLESIDDGEVTMLEVLNEEYGDWYGYEEDGDNEEFYYEDPENICESINHACSLLHECVDREMYQECYELADFLLQMEVVTESDYSGEALSMRDLIRKGMVSQDYEAFVMEALLAAYWGNSMPDRPEAVYWALVMADEKNATLEALIQQSPKELEDFQEFLKLWIAYLGKADGDTAGRCLREAVTLANSPETLLDAARKYVDLHPFLYIEALKQYQAEIHPEENAPGEAASVKLQLEKALEIGQEALAHIFVGSQERNQAALLSAEFALQLGNRETAEQCWLEALRSKCDVVNYLRLVMESGDFEKYRQQAEEICHKFFAEPIQKERQGYYSATKPYYAILFFSGQFQRMMAEGMKTDAALGWSGTFMKEGMALLFLYLYQGESLPKGCSRKCRNCVQSLHFRSEEYLEGTGHKARLGEEAAKEDQGFFWEYFRKWRERIQISEQEQEEIIQKLEQWTKKRVAGIMENNRRNYYGECAAFVAALGKVKESRGEPGAKQRTLEAYRSAYSRRRAFHQELRNYGMY